MNLDFEFRLLPNTVKMAQRLRSYEITFNFPAFKTKGSAYPTEINYGSLTLLYIPRNNLLEFYSLQEYINKYSEVSIPLETAAWSIVDDIYYTVQPCYAMVQIQSVLGDCVTTDIVAQIGGRHKNIHVYLEGSNDSNV